MKKIKCKTLLKHTWQPRKKEKPELGFICITCNEKFPCTQRDCGHFDCIEFKLEHNLLSPICCKCRKPVEFNIGIITFGKELNLKMNNCTIDGNTKLICEQCSNKGTKCPK